MFRGANKAVFFFLPYVYEKKINKNFPLKLNFALSVFPSNRAPFFRGQLPDDLFYFFKFFLPPGFNLLAKEKKAKKKSNFFLKKLQGNEDFYAKVLLKTFRLNGNTIGFRPQTKVRETNP